MGVQSILNEPLERSPGEPLSERLRAGPMEIAEFLRIGIALCSEVERLHSHRVLHRDLRPEVFELDFKDPLAPRAWITDFKDAILQEPAQKSARVREHWVGSLPYLSPEQSGRMNRSPDQRSDLYSLGVIFYRMLAGRLPFTAGEPLEWIHAHIAKPPQKLREIRPDLPVVLERIVLRLLSKSAEERYQSAAGLRADLRRCQQALDPVAGIPDFRLGELDQSDALSIPEKLYGREADVQRLLASYERVVETGRSEGVLVTGEGGIGKSALIHEIHRPVIARRGFFISGKFDQYRRSVPYSALAQALRELVHLLLARPEEELNRWKAKILAATGANARLVVDLVPDLEAVIGPQSEVVRIDPREAQTRLGLTLRSFLGVFSNAEHPLVVFVDDLQWTDLASLELIRAILSSQGLSHLLLIAAYRDNEVEASHPLNQALAEISAGGARLERIGLSAISPRAVLELVSETLRLPPDGEVRELSELIFRKTEGNPFFVVQFIETLVQENVLRFSWDRRRWVWDVRAIHETGITSNVVDLLIRKVRSLPEATLEALRLSACISSVFDVKTLATISRRDFRQALHRISPAVEAGLLVPMNERAYSALAQASPRAGGAAPEPQAPAGEGIVLGFLHDRVQQAAYSLIDESERSRIHLEIGQLLLQDSGGGEREERLFDIVSHLNQGKSRIIDPEEKLQRVRLNLRAGAKAKASAAFDLMLQVMGEAKSGLPADAWERATELAEAAWLGLAEAQSANGRIEDSERLLDDLIGRTRSIAVRIEAYRIRIRNLAVVGKLRESFQAALEILEELGVHFPKKARLADTIKEFATAKVMLAFRSAEEVARMPLAKDPLRVAAMAIMGEAAPTATQVAPRHFLLLGLRTLQETLKHGLTQASAYGFSTYSLILAKLGRFAEAKRMSDLALRLLDSVASIAEQPVGRGGQARYMRWYWESFKEVSVKHLRPALEASQAVGNLEMTGYYVGAVVWYDFLSGDALEGLVPRAQAASDFIALKNTRSPYHENAPLFQLLHLLQDPEGTYRPPLSGKFYDETAAMDELHRTGNELAELFATAGIAYAALLFGDHEQAFARVERVRNVAARNPPNFFYPILYFSGAVSAARSARGDGVGKSRGRRLAASAWYLTRLKKWAGLNPENFLASVLQAEAELLSARGQADQASARFEKAVAAALGFKNLREAAVASEAFADHLMRSGRPDQAAASLKQAHELYRRWGAPAKMRQLESRYPAAFPSGDASLKEGSLDLGSVIKASQAISGEIRTSGLTDKLLRIAIENAGAQRGAILLLRDGAFSEEASISFSAPEAGSSSRPGQGFRVPSSVIQYVSRTGESVILDDPARGDAASAFSLDPDLADRKPRSVLALPIRMRSKLMGILYLENSLVSGAFAPKMLALLDVIAAQAAISLENAAFYEELESRVEERTRQLQVAQQQLVFSAKMSSLGEMAGGIAHEINTPLAIIQLVAERIRDLGEEIRSGSELSRIQESAAQLESMADRVLSTTQRIAKIIQGLRSFAREGTQDPFRMESPRKIVEETLSFCQERIKGQGVSIEVQAIPEEWRVPCRAAQISQILLNLLNNSFDAVQGLPLEKRWIRVAAEVSSAAEAGHRCLELSVEDGGSLVDPAVRSRLFQPFFTTKPIGKGTGLGLSVSRGIAQSHGGDLSLDESSPRTRFVLKLPLG